MDIFGVRVIMTSYFYLELHLVSSDKIDASRVKGILIDCGDVILHAPGNRWWPPPFVAPVLEKWSIEIEANDVAPGMRKMSRLLDENHHLHTSTEAENEQFRKYSRFALVELGHDDPDDALIEELVRLQSDPEWYIVYEETEPVMMELNARGYILHMLSNSFRYLKDIMRVKGLDKYFDGMTISAYVGCMKPDDRIFQAAIDAIGLPAGDLLYIDDIPRYVEKAASLGMQGLILDRSQACSLEKMPIIKSLNELLDLLPGPHG